MPQADAEHGPGADELPAGLDGIVQRAGIAGAVGQEEAVRRQRQGFGRGGRRRYHGDPAALFHQFSDDVLLDPVVEGDHVKAGIGRTGFIGLRAGHALDHVHPFQALPLPGSAHQTLRVQILGGQGRVHHAVKAHPSGQLPGVDAFYADDVVFLQVGGQALGRAPVARYAGALLHHEAPHVGAGGFVVLWIDPVVADQGVGHGDDLAGVRGIGEDLLVPGHAGVEDHLSQGFTGDPAAGAAFEHGAVRQGDEGFHLEIVTPSAQIRGNMRAATEPTKYSHC